MTRLLRLVGLTMLGLLLAIWLVSPVQAQGGDIYVVQPGDSLTGIAARYGLNASELASANGLAWDAWLYAGQQLTIPGQPQPAAAGPAAAPLSYTVGPGDTLDKIAFQYQTSVQALEAANGLSASGSIYPGQELIISWITPAPEPAAPSRTDLGEGDWVEIDPPSAQPAPPEPAPVEPPPAPAPVLPPPPPPLVYETNGEKWIDVNLTNQTLTAYEGQLPVFSALVSSGLPQYPTVVGTYAIYVKYTSARMRGGYGWDAYDLPNVPYVMYFYKGYGLHGTYWHSNFGTPMSHGCVNLATPDAEWIYNWAPIGTKVVSHY